MSELKFPAAALVVGDVLGGDFGAFTATFMMNSQLILIPKRTPKQEHILVYASVTVFKWKAMYCHFIVPCFGDVGEATVPVVK